MKKLILAILIIMCLVANAEAQFIGGSSVGDNITGQFGVVAGETIASGDVVGINNDYILKATTGSKKLSEWFTPFTGNYFQRRNKLIKLTDTTYILIGCEANNANRIYVYKIFVNSYGVIQSANLLNSSYYNLQYNMDITNGVQQAYYFNGCRVSDTAFAIYYYGNSNKRLLIFNTTDTTMTTNGELQISDGQTSYVAGGMICLKSDGNYNIITFQIDSSPAFLNIFTFNSSYINISNNYRIDIQNFAYTNSFTVYGNSASVATLIPLNDPQSFLLTITTTLNVQTGYIPHEISYKINIEYNSVASQSFTKYKAYARKYEPKIYEEEYESKVNNYYSGIDSYWSTSDTIYSNGYYITSNIKQDTTYLYIPVSTFSKPSRFGIALNNSGSVQIKGRVSNQTGLIAGNYYKVINGVLRPTVNKEGAFGQALSATEFLIY